MKFYNEILKTRLFVTLDSNLKIRYPEEENVASILVEKEKQNPENYSI